MWIVVGMRRAGKENSGLRKMMPIPPEVVGREISKVYFVVTEVGVVFDH